MNPDRKTLGLAGDRTAEAGTVYLVGAGPGDPDLITAGGLSLLRTADVVVHDRLIGPALLWECRADATVVDVGKAPRDHKLSQDGINALLVEHATAGRSVVRLKGGDPFVYGRGFEELQACRAANVPCRVLPGVSSALAAPAVAGIPVTVRGGARTVLIATPQTGEGERLNAPDFAALAAADTACLLMCRAMIADVARQMIAAGKPPGTPAAVVSSATLPNQRSAVGTLATIADVADAAGIDNPAVIVVGETAALADSSADVAADQPLAGRRVVVTRPATASANLVRELSSRGATAVDCPLIRVEHADPASWPDGFGEAGAFDWAVFTSLHGVRAFWRAVRRRGLDARVLGGAKIAAVGPKTAAELVRCGWVADLVPGEFRAKALIASLSAEVAGGRVLFPCGTLARDELAVGLRSAGATVEEVVVYDTLPTPPDAAARREFARGVDAVLLYSPSAARALADGISGTDGRGGFDLGDAAIGCIGPTTADAARAAGLRVDFEPAAYTDAGMLDALGRHLDAARS